MSRRASGQDDDRYNTSHHRYAEKDQINIDTHENVLPIDYYIDCDGDHPATIYEDFMENLFGLVESKRRYGFIRL
ncbi:hypothetical protein Tco_0042548, partial [Tanacetum coccineum]